MVFAYPIRQPTQKVSNHITRNNNNHPKYDVIYLTLLRQPVDLLIYPLIIPVDFFSEKS